MVNLTVKAVAAFAFIAFSTTGTSQHAKVPRIGVLSSETPEAPRARLLRQGLRERGYSEGRDLILDWRSSQGRPERFAQLAADLAQRKVDVIVASDNPAIAAAQTATQTIPIVMVLAGDPVGTRFVASLAKPGGNITGLTFLAPETQSKSVELLKEALPRASRIAILWGPAEPGRQAVAEQALAAARRLGMHGELIGVRSGIDLDAAFESMAKQRVDAAIVQPAQIMFAERSRIAELAAINRIATVGWSGDVVAAGILMSYGPNIPDLYRRSAYYVDRILKGAKPAELPVEQPTMFELTINLRTAGRLGITIPKALLSRVDHVFE